MCMSVPQIDVASIRTRMSRRPGLRVGQGSKTAPGPGDFFTTACIFSFNRFPRNWSHCRFDRVVKRYWRAENAILTASMGLGDCAVLRKGLREVAYHNCESRLGKYWVNEKKECLEYQLPSGDDSYSQRDGLDQRTAR